MGNSTKSKHAKTTPFQVSKAVPGWSPQSGELEVMVQTPYVLAGEFDSAALDLYVKGNDEVSAEEVVSFENLPLLTCFFASNSNLKEVLKGEQKQLVNSYFPYGGFFLKVGKSASISLYANMVPATGHLDAFANKLTFPKHLRCTPVGITFALSQRVVVVDQPNLNEMQSATPYGTN